MHMTAKSYFPRFPSKARNKLCHSPHPTRWVGLLLLSLPLFYRAVCSAEKVCVVSKGPALVRMAVSGHTEAAWLWHRLVTGVFIDVPVSG